jgi:hypothetical protein
MTDAFECSLSRVGSINPFIFPPIASYRSHKTHADRDRNHNKYNSWKFWVNSGLSKLSIPTGFEETNRFFRREASYHAHSLQLVEEIPIWLDLRNFDECYYADYEVRFEKGIETYESYMGVPYLGYLKLHLEAAYPDITDLYNRIKKNHTDWSQKIKEIMSGQNIPYKPSFEKIIIDRISNCCPALKRSRDTELSKNNMYINQSVFNILFKTLYNGLQLNALEVKANDITPKLEYNHNTIIAQGDVSNMYKLNDTINDLVNDEDLKKIIENYRELSKGLADDDIDVWKSKLMSLHHSVKGGEPLKGDGACKLCPTHPD